jgi:hypothetical protein
MDALFDWMTGTWINYVVLMYAWSWPTLETLHFIGLCMLMGSLLIMDLRLIGFQRAIPLSAVHSLMPVAIIGFVINLVTGLGFLFGDPRNYYGEIGFRLKMLFLLFAGLNFLLYYFKVDPLLKTASPTAPTPPLAKTVGAASLFFWFGVLAFGRLLPYLGGGAG